MTGARDLDARTEARPPSERPNYTGAVYGSLLAASVVAGAAGGGHYDLSPLRLAAALLATGMVFWLAHAYARLVGDRIQHVPLDRQEIRRVAKHEWPLFQSALPPAGAALLFGLFGAGDPAAGWAALVVAIVEQVGWATFATVRSGASRSLVVATALGNLALGLLIVVLKTALLH
jgi:hypothetical protein